jgi:hypothetical protein
MEWEVLTNRRSITLSNVLEKDDFPSRLKDSVNLLEEDSLVRNLAHDSTENYVLWGIR